MSGLYNQISSPASQRANSPNINMRSNFDVDSHYLTELLQEHQKLGPFMQVLPLCSRLLNQESIINITCALLDSVLLFIQVLLILSIIFIVSEILRVSGKNGMLQNQVGFSDFDRMQYVSPSHMVSSDITPNFTGWNSLSHDRLSGVQGLNVDWQTSPQAVPNSHIVKKILRLDIPKEGYPNVRYFNFVGRLLGPRGNSLKRVEATTGCRVFIRGKGSIKDLDKEELLRGRPGYEHLNDPLHILIEAELPASVVDVRLRQAQEIIQELLKPVDESQDFYKRQQLRELAMLNSNFREESPQLSVTREGKKEENSEPKRSVQEKSNSIKGGRRRRRRRRRRRKKMGKGFVPMKAVTYGLSPFHQKIMPGLWKDLPTKIHHKVSENWISATLLLGPLVGVYSK
ncbi:hypothetical protein Ahy_B01g051572 isoform A [Arachis hypogaea]|uniref:K Homology domain-containing protein n=1 Tax=Arachis hypogaea TaxID=3818 RepID=A0A445AM80_ARAHY|nr:hypothetical protein Ahy_B01g051572 isoform A [Arachis hypogaea]